MAIYPDDYRKIVTKVTQKGSRIAVKARNLIGVIARFFYSNFGFLSPVRCI
jgi:hypothetical protein